MEIAAGGIHFLDHFIIMNFFLLFFGEFTEHRFNNSVVLFNVSRRKRVDGMLCMFE